MKDSKQCRLCGDCCTTVGIEIETPETHEDFDFIKWYIFHKGLTVYIDRDGTWNVEIATKCNYLGPDKKCKIYDDRPAVCREFSPDQCNVTEEEEEDDSVMIEFSTPEAVDDYVSELVDNGEMKPRKTDVRGKKIERKKTKCSNKCASCKG